MREFLDSNKLPCLVVEACLCQLRAPTEDALTSLLQTMTVREDKECLRPRRTDRHVPREGVGTHQEWRCRHVRSRGHGSRPGGGDGQERIRLGGGEEWKGEVMSAEEFMCRQKNNSSRMKKISGEVDNEWIRRVKDKDGCVSKWKLIWLVKNK